MSFEFTPDGMTHPLLAVLLDAANGRFPPADGAVTFLPGLSDGNRAIVALTGHAYVATDQAADEFDDLVLDGFGAALSPTAMLRVAGNGEIGVNDVVLVARGTGRGMQTPITDTWDDHPRVAHARHLRSNVEVYGTDEGFVTLSTGLAGRVEMSVEIADTELSSGIGRRLILDGVAGVSDDQYVFAAVAPGNARSLRSFLAAGFIPIGGEVIIDRNTSEAS